MKSKLFAFSAMVAAAIARLDAADPAPAAPAPTPTPANAPADAAPAAVSPVTAELTSIVQKVKAKLQAGTTTEEGLSDELKAFDALLDAHKGEKTEEVAQVLWMKALLYVQVFQNLDTAETLFTQMKNDFPGTEMAKHADEILPMLAKQNESAKMEASLKPGEVFPDFSEKDLEGDPLSLSQHKGKVVLIDFWATWCGPCVNELPNVLAAYQKFHDKGFEIVGISLDKDKAQLESFTKEHKMTWAQYFDGLGWENKLSTKYGITSIPATFLVGTDGKIVAKNLRGPALEAELAKLLK
jgi:peroxiredoxin